MSGALYDQVERTICNVYGKNFPNLGKSKNGDMGQEMVLHLEMGHGPFYDMEVAHFCKTFVFFLVGGVFSQMIS